MPNPPSPAPKPFPLAPKHSRAIRWFHWINFPLLSLMIASGLLIYWANDIYRVGMGEWTLLRFFPDSFYRLFAVDHKLALGMAWHFALMWVFAINGFLYVGYTIYSGEWRELVPDRRSYLEALQVMLHDLHLSKYSPPPRKFNGAQRLAYTGIIVMGACSLVTGVAIYRPVQFNWLVALLGGYEWVRFAHFWLTIGYFLFFLIHVAQVARAGWNNFRAMVSGYELPEASAAVSSRASANPSELSREVSRATRRSFIVGGATFVLGAFGWRLLNQAQTEGGLAWPFRRVFGWNEKLSRAYFSPERLSSAEPKPPLDKEARPNGDVGLQDKDENESEPSSIQVLSPAPPGVPTVREISIAEIKSLPRTEYTTPFKCIEGWSDVNQYAGVKFSDFLRHYGLGMRSGGEFNPARAYDLFEVVGLETPDRKYYVSIDMASMLHPQTLLCYEINGQPLTAEHGAPLRLAIPVKYGIKNLKNIGTIRFADARLPDYWAERGYDWYAGL